MILLDRTTQNITNAELQELGGFALIDKPVGPTSFAMVYRLRKLTGVKRVGHAGTLDPLASGLLILAFGKATKKIHQFQGLPKSYLFTIKLGATTATDDAAAAEEQVTDVSHITAADVAKIIPQFTGTISQRPPAFSAIKVAGERAYDLARKGQELQLAERPIMVYQMVITSFELPHVTFEVWCSKGTYVRSLARDIGAVLGCGAYVTHLRRTGIGLYLVSNALTTLEAR
jgi:tRNA pseudouridine55 synthase